MTIGSLKYATLTWPVRVRLADGRGGSRITQEYRPPDHMGVDIAVPGHLHDADADVVAVAPGTVVAAGIGERGGFVLIDHGDYASGYLHLATLAVRRRDRVEAGSVLGTMGADPKDGQAIVHLHFQLAPGGKAVDPAKFLEKAE